MALSTTQSIWRSGGGDQTRTAYCGSGMMAAQFYIPNAASTANVLVAAGGPPLILPKGAVVLSVEVQTPGTGSVDLNTTGYTSGTNTIGFIGSDVDVSAKASIGLGTAGTTGNVLTEMSYVQSSDNTSGAGIVSGYLTYFVVDPLAGQQNV